MKNLSFMMGDWALLDNKPVQVNETNFHEDLKPMPLTLQILVINDFVIGYPGNPCISTKYHNDGLAVLSLARRKDDNNYADDDDNISRFILRLRPSGKNFDLHYTVCCVDTVFRHVHQLQHALRLIGHDLPIDIE